MSDIYCRSAPENVQTPTTPEERKYTSDQNINAPKKLPKLSPKKEKNKEESRRRHLESRTKNCHHNNINISEFDVVKKNGRKRTPLVSKCTPHLNLILNQSKDDIQRSRCSQRAPIGPPGAQQCKCSAPHYFNNLLNQSEYEIADDASKVQTKNVILQNANFNEDFEYADDAISLNGEILEERSHSRTSLHSSKSVKNENTFINVNGKEELPSREQIKNPEININVAPIPQEKTDNLSNSEDGDVDVQIKMNDGGDDFDGNCNKVKFSTLPRRKRNHVNHKMWYRPVLEPPHRITPDGTDIYYWCDVPKRTEHGKEICTFVFIAVLTHLT